MADTIAVFGITLGIPTVCALAWHFLSKRWALASLGAALSSGAISMAIFHRAMSAAELSLFFFLFSACGLIIALGVGLPFYRLRTGRSFGMPAEVFRWFRVKRNAYIAGFLGFGIPLGIQVLSWFKYSLEPWSLVIAAFALLVGGVGMGRAVWSVASRLPDRKGHDA